MEWTEEQKKVIELRNRNILVSAAAGSGKTAVLVERIIQRITDEKNPIDMDRLVVVTFTKAAAAEMRERIGKALEERAYRDPKNVRLQKQASLLSHAQISTIDSFCMTIVKNYFHTIELDPGFRMGDEGEMNLLKADVMEAVLEKNYAKCIEDGEEGYDFVNLVETFATGKSDKGLEDMVYRLYEKAMSNPWPKEWLFGCKDSFNIETVRQMEGTVWMKELMKAIRKSLLHIREWNRETIRICGLPEGPDMQTLAMMDDKQMIQALLAAKDYAGMYECMKEMKFTRLSSKKGGDPELRAKVSELRGKVKKGMEDIRKKYFYQAPERMVTDIKGSRNAILSLIDLTLEFMEGFREAKEEKNLLDFNDLEHFALQILTKKEGGEITYTPVAEELMEYYEEIMIDEYQDSNLVQETILNAISGDRQDNPNLFMVGDVKQSIYRFRLARPELFMEKYDQYNSGDPTRQRIDLQKNFRSREMVLSGVNLLFSQIMKKDLGGIEYNEEAALYPGRVFEETEWNTSENIDVLLVTTEKGEEPDGQTEVITKEKGKVTREGKRLMEARVVGERILEMTNKEKGLHLYEGDGYRLAEYKDVVILLRSMSGWAEMFTEVLLSMGIPAYTDTKTGYFTTLEVQTVLNSLKIMDNPRQDIPLAAVLRSPIGGFSNEELARIRAFHKNGELYVSLRAYGESGEDPSLKGRVRGFLDWLNAYRRMVPYMKVYELIQKLYEDTGYYYQVMAMPDGERRSGNLDMLLQKAVEYDSTSYKGLFSFNRYMEKLDKYEVDYGEASVMGGSGNAVRIMSVHKSKGLEFPIVFVSGMGKEFNQKESREPLVIHSDLGVGSNFIDYENRTKIPTIMQRAIQNRIKEDNYGEELRVLYVAMTRAKEKLLLTGFVEQVEDAWMKWGGKNGGYLDLMNGLTYFDWIMPPLLNGEETAVKQPFYCQVIAMPSEEELEAGERRLLHEKKEGLLHWDTDVIYDQELHMEMIKRKEYRYPYQNDLSLPILVSVTDLKRRSVEEEESLDAFPKFPVRKEPVPGFKKDALRRKDVSMKEVGTAYHTVMQHLRFGGIDGMEGLNKEIQRLKRESRIKEQEAEWLSFPSILAFLESDLGKRMRMAEEQGNLYREQPFVIGLPADEVNVDYKSKEMVLVQGIVDAFFEEGEALVLVDYKTDELSKGEEEELIKHYGVQLRLYRKALEGVTKKRVKEAMIYSFALGKTIHL